MIKRLINIDSRKAMSKGCIFCQLKNDEIAIDGKLAFVFADNFPVTIGHSLIIPKRHFESFFDINDEELLEINSLIKLRKKQLLNQDKTIEGFNIGTNIGIAGGQSIFHVHIHLIPRRSGDVENPKGGIRGIIPNKKEY